MPTAWFYVKDDGTAVAEAGRTETQRTGAFSAMGGTSTYYASISTLLAAAVTSPPTTGDYIMVSDTADKSLSGDNIQAVGASYVISVDDLNCENYKAGASQKTTSTSHYLDLRPLTKNIPLTVNGLSSVAGESMSFGTSTDHMITIWEDGNIGKTSTSASEWISIGGNNSEGHRVDLINTNVTCGAGGNGFIIGGGGTLNITGGALIGTPEPFIDAGLAGGRAYVRDFDLSSMTAGSFLVSDNIAETGGVHAEFTRCKLPATFLIFDDTTTLCETNIVNLWSCDNGDGYHYFHYHRPEGEGFEDTGVYRTTSGATYDGTNEFSTNITTTSKVVAFTRPIRIPLGTYELDLTSGATLTFYVAMHDTATASPTALTDHEFWIELEYPDNTDNALGVFAKSNVSTDILSTPTNLTTSTEAWTGLDATYQTKQEVEITIPTVTGMTKAPVTAYACLARDITSEGTATEFFICPKPLATA